MKLLNLSPTLCRDLKGKEPRKGRAMRACRALCAWRTHILLLGEGWVSMGDGGTPRHGGANPTESMSVKRV